MKIPRKIDHSFLKDSVVEIRYESNIEQEIVNGYVYEGLKKINFYPQILRPEFIGKPSIIESPNIFVGGDPIYYDDNTSVKFNIYSIVFNKKDEYPLWENYFIKIQSVLNILDNLKLFKKILRIGIRYINVFFDLDIFEIMNECFRLSIPGITTMNTHIKTEIIDNTSKSILNIANGFMLPQYSKPASIYDIDVIVEYKDNYELNKLLSTIDGAHKKETELFFGYLKPEFIKSLNPKY